MAKDKSRTHWKIMKIAREEFLLNGFKNTSMRTIAQKAGISATALYRHFKNKETMFGALVEPALQEFNQGRLNDNSESYGLLEREDLAKLRVFSDERFRDKIEFIYNNHDTFKLLLTCAEGTKYSAFQHDLVINEVQMILRLKDYLTGKGMKVNQVDEQDLHLIMSGLFSALFEFTIHDYSKEEALRRSQVLSVFFHSGLQNVLIRE